MFRKVQILFLSFIDNSNGVNYSLVYSRKGSSHRLNVPVSATGIQQINHSFFWSQIHLCTWILHITCVYVRIIHEVFVCCLSSILWLGVKPIYLQLDWSNKSESNKPFFKMWWCAAVTSTAQQTCLHNYRELSFLLKKIWNFWLLALRTLSNLQHGLTDFIGQNIRAQQA